MFAVYYFKFLSCLREKENLVTERKYILFFYFKNNKSSVLSYVLRTKAICELVNNFLI